MILSFELTCYQCGGDTTELARGTPHARRTCSTVLCTVCGSELLVSVQLDPIRLRKAPS